jgi:hypothetical protein
MKKHLLLAAFIAPAFFLNAQKFNWGVRGGVNISSLSDYEMPIYQRPSGSFEYSEFENRPGAYAGFFVQFALSGNLGLETGLYYAQLGGKDKERDYEQGTLVQYKIDANPSYLQLPVALYYKLNFTDRFKIYPSAGLYAGYGLTGNLKQQGSVGDIPIDSKVKYFDNFANKFDLGLTVGLNIEYSKFVFGVHYERGFTRVNKTEILYSNNAYNSNVRCSLAYLFR